MKNLNKAFLLIIFIASIASCKKIDDLQKDPAAIYNPQPSLILTGILLNISESPWSTDQRHNQYMVLNEEYYGGQSYDWSTGSYDDFTQLKNVVRLEVEAQKNEVNGIAYAALAKFLKAYFFINATQKFGDIPIKEALQGSSQGIFKPKYDKQEDVYVQCLQWLNEANEELTTIISENNLMKVDGDFFYNGDLGKWQKLVNSFRLRVLISLSKRADDTPSLNIKEQFSMILNNPVQYPIILDNADNFQLEYNSANRDNNYPLWPADGDVIKQDLRNNLGATYIDILKETKDPRIFIVAWPTDSAKESGDPDYASKFTSYRGGKTGMLQSNLKDLSVAGKLSQINFDYWVASPSGIPCVQFGAYETHFLIAEGISRGWATGNASENFQKGITESMKFYGISQEKIDEFLSNPKNQYTGNNQNGLKQILQQKYVAFFQNSGRQAFYNFRRTGIPVFDIGPANANNNAIPVRWAYPTSEYTVNEDNLKSALQRQYNGSDTQNDVMWLIK